MILKLKAYLGLGINCQFIVGELVIKNQEIVKFIETPNTEVIQDFSKVKFPLKRSEFEVIFFDEFHEEKKIFDALIKIKDGFNVGVKLKYTERIKLKWILKKYRIQQPKNQWDVFAFIIGTLLTVIGLVLALKK
jgi:hypothetical protein